MNRFCYTACVVPRCLPGRSCAPCKSPCSFLVLSAQSTRPRCLRTYHNCQLVGLCHQWYTFVAHAFLAPPIVSICGNSLPNPTPFGLTLRLPRIGYRSPTDACSVRVSTAVYDGAHWLVGSDHLSSVLFALPKSCHTCESCNLTGTCTGM